MREKAIGISDFGCFDELSTSLGFRILDYGLRIFGLRIADASTSSAQVSELGFQILGKRKEKRKTRSESQEDCSISEW
ncbi:MAG TPA: hypothetical protein VLA71_01165 [Algoriphagus sp.]|nr:hypothetical protein [Algoriphagus sp.]